jgi:hypothetical protein
LLKKIRAYFCYESLPLLPQIKRQKEKKRGKNGLDDLI